MKQRRLWWLFLIPLAWGVRTVMAPPTTSDNHHDGSETLQKELQTMSGPQRLMRLKEQLDSPLPATRVAAAELLAEPQADRWSMIILMGSALRDNDSEVRRKATYALTKCPLTEVAPALSQLLQDDDLWIRQEVAQAVTILAAREPEHLKPLEPALVRALDDPDPAVRSSAANGLCRLEKKDWHLSAKASPTEVSRVRRLWKDALKGLPALATRTVETRPQRQDPVPDLPLTDLKGTVHNAAHAGKLTLINFWGTWCPPCRLELPRLQTLSQQEGVAVIGVALEEESTEALQRFCQKQGLTYPQVRATKALTDAYGDIHELPVTVLVDAKGKIRYRWQGERADGSFQKAVARLQRETSKGDTINPDGRHNLR